MRRVTQIAMSQPKIVKRYANRKLYDTERSCYVTLEDISLMIKAGEEVQVIDNKSGDDLTSVTLAQIIFETEKKKNFMSLALLRDLIQNGGEHLTGFAKEGVDKVKAGAQDVVESATARAGRLREQADRIRTGLEERVKGPDSRLKWLVDVQRSLEEIQKGVEEKIRDGVGLVGREVDEWRQRLGELQARLDRSEAATREGEGSTNGNDVVPSSSEPEATANKSEHA